MTTRTLRVLVLGGYGAVGAPATAALRAAGHTCLTAGRDPRRADLALDLARREDYRRALEGVDVVVNAAGAEDPALAALAAEHGAAFVDPTASSGYTARLERLAPRAPVLLGVGLAPGLTGLLAADLHAARPGPEPVEVAVLLGEGEAHGAAATAWTLGLLGRSFPDPATGEPVRNLSRGAVFDLPGRGRRRLLRADFADQHALTRDLGRPVRTHLGLDSAALTRALGLLARLPGAGRLPGVPRLPGSDVWTAAARSGPHLRLARGRGQSRATAAVTAHAAALAAGLEPGVHHLHRVLALPDLPAWPGLALASSDA
ncbi:NAD-dependent epimerase/dehydratase family protein [Nocardiopsis flavescens]|uniref:NAD-dependent epimerase/dehydratase family protein n=2 Tax=Nocardiopsis flavescens TaxID=758803 RepID=UPI0036DC4E07